MTICRPILCLPWCSTSKVHLRSIFVTTEGRGLFTSALFWRIFGQIGPYCTTLPSVTPSTLPPKQNMHGGCPKSRGLCPTFELNALVGTSMPLVNCQGEFGRDKRCSGSSKSTHGQTSPRSQGAKKKCIFNGKYINCGLYVHQEAPSAFTKRPSEPKSSTI